MMMRRVRKMGMTMMRRRRRAMMRMRRNAMMRRSAGSSCSSSPRPSHVDANSIIDRE